MTHDTPPKRIWVIPDASGVKHEWHSGWYQGRPNGRHRVEYILASEVDAMVAAASQGAAVAVSERADWPEDDRGRTLHPELFARVATVILGLIPQPAAAALDKLIREAEARGMEQIASELHQMAMMVPDYESSKILENRASALRTIAAPTRAAEETGT